MLPFKIGKKIYTLSRQKVRVNARPTTNRTPWSAQTPFIMLLMPIHRLRALNRTFSQPSSLPTQKDNQSDQTRGSAISVPCRTYNFERIWVQQSTCPGPRSTSYEEMSIPPPCLETSRPSAHSSGFAPTFWPKSWQINLFSPTQEDLTGQLKGPRKSRNVHNHRGQPGLWTLLT